VRNSFPLLFLPFTSDPFVLYSLFPYPSVLRLLFRFASLPDINFLYDILLTILWFSFIFVSHQNGRFLEQSFSERWLWSVISCGIQRQVASKLLLSAYFARVTFRPWKWRWYIPPNVGCFTGVDRIIPEKTELFKMVGYLFISALFNLKVLFLQLIVMHWIRRSTCKTSRIQCD
jgi:hypothetical protein